MALCLATLLALGVAEASHAIVAGQIDTFQNGTTLNGVEALQGAIAPAPPTLVANAGPDGVGDFALRLTVTGSALGLSLRAGLLLARSPGSCRPR